MEAKLPMGVDVTEKYFYNVVNASIKDFIRMDPKKHGDFFVRPKMSFSPSLDRP